MLKSAILTFLNAIFKGIPDKEEQFKVRKEFFLDEIVGYQIFPGTSVPSELLTQVRVYTHLTSAAIDLKPYTEEFEKMDSANADAAMNSELSAHSSNLFAASKISDEVVIRQCRTVIQYIHSSPDLTHRFMDILTHLNLVPKTGDTGFAHSLPLFLSYGLFLICSVLLLIFNVQKIASVEFNRSLCSKHCWNRWKHWN